MRVVLPEAPCAQRLEAEACLVEMNLIGRIHSTDLEVCRGESLVSLRPPLKMLDAEPQ